MTKESSKTEMSNTNGCRHQDGSPCHCTANRLLSQSSVITSDYLFAERNEVQILHEGEVYRLRITKNGKLILNK